MRIEKIKYVKSNLYEIIVSKEGKEETIKLTEEAVIKHNLLKARDIDASMYETLLSLQSYSAFYSQALNYLSYKMRTEMEVEDYLKGKDCHPNHRLSIIQKLKSLNYINDQLYAELFTREQFFTNRKGPVWIQDALIKRGIRKSFIQTALQQITEVEILETIEHLISLSDKKNEKKPINKLKESLTRNLTNRGFSYQSINEVMKDYRFKEPSELESVLAKELEKSYRRLSRKYEGFDLKQRVVTRLVQKGFDYSLVNEVYKRIDEERVG